MGRPKAIPGRQREPWEAGPWCRGCKYLVTHAVVEFECDYFYITHQMRPDGEPTKQCSVKETRKIIRRPRNADRPDRTRRRLGSVEGYLTYGDIAAVIRKKPNCVQHYNTDRLINMPVEGRFIDGWLAKQFTVEEAALILRGREFEHIEDEANLKTIEQLALREILLKRREIPEG